MIWIKLFVVIVSAQVGVSVLKIIFKTLVSNTIKGMNERLPKAKPGEPEKPQVIASRKTYYDDGTKEKSY